MVLIVFQAAHVNTGYCYSVPTFAAFVKTFINLSFDLHSVCVAAVLVRLRSLLRFLTWLVHMHNWASKPVR
jgi:hypothetical protein